MIHALYTLKKEYLDKKIYIWNINRNSIGVFMRAAIRGINVQGFVSVEKQYLGGTYMNRPIVSLEQAEEDDNSIILIGEDVPENVIKMISNDKAVYWMDAQEISNDLRQKNIIVYGIGKGSEKLCDNLQAESIGVDLYCVSKRGSAARCRGKQVIVSNDLEKYKDYHIIISVMNPQYQMEIMQILEGLHRDAWIDYDYLMDKPEELLDFIQNINFAINDKRDIFIYGKKNMVSGLIEDTLKTYGIRIDGYVNDTEDTDNGIVSIDRLREKTCGRKVLFIINELIKEDLICARAEIEKIGFTLENRDYTSMKWYVHDNRWMLRELRWCNDSLVGKTTVFSQGKLGWKQYGNEGIKIMVLGNSTSSETVHSENWISKLYSKFQAENINVTLYNEANICDDIVSGILRLLRDGYALQPQIVICMSGVNNTVYKECTNQFNEEKLIWGMKNGDFYDGMDISESLYSFWLRNMKILKHIAECQGICFYGFLQPMNITMAQMNLYEKSLFESERHIIGAKTFDECADDESGYINLMRLFEHKNGMFVDICHYTNKAQEMIADKVYEAVIQKVHELNNGNRK